MRSANELHCPPSEPATTMVRPAQVSGRPSAVPARPPAKRRLRGALNRTALIGARPAIGGLVGLIVGLATIITDSWLPFQPLRPVTFLTSPILVAIRVIEPAEASAVAMFLLGSLLLYSFYGFVSVDSRTQRLRWPWLTGILATHCACHAAWHGLIMRAVVAHLPL